jgi:hypothetical protein
MSEELSAREKELLAKYASGRHAKRWKKVVAQRLAEQFAGGPDATQEPAPPGAEEGAAREGSRESDTNEGSGESDTSDEARPARRRGTSR